MRTVWIWDETIFEWVEESEYLKKKEEENKKFAKSRSRWNSRDSFKPRTYHNMADHPVHVTSRGELKAALKKYNCYERG